jgi:hypothetical protein
MRKKKEPTQIEKIKSIGEYMKSNRWFNDKNYKYLKAVCAHFDSIWSRQEHECRFTGTHALWHIYHTRSKKRISEGLSGEAIKIIESLKGELKTEYAR